MRTRSLLSAGGVLAAALLTAGEVRASAAADEPAPSAVRLEKLARELGMLRVSLVLTGDAVDMVQRVQDELRAAVNQRRSLGDAECEAEPPRPRCTEELAWEQRYWVSSEAQAAMDWSTTAADVAFVGRLSFDLRDEGGAVRARAELQGRVVAPGGEIEATVQRQVLLERSERKHSTRAAAAATAEWLRAEAARRLAVQAGTEIRAHVDRLQRRGLWVKLQVASTDFAGCSRLSKTLSSFADVDRVDSMRLRGESCELQVRALRGGKGVAWGIVRTAGPEPVWQVLRATAGSVDLRPFP